MFFLLFLVHLPLFIKPIFTADVLLNNSFYNGYSWEISLGRFGLYVLGILKNYTSVPSVELILSFLLLIGTSYLLIRLFDIKDKLPKIFIIIFMVLSPIVSATLLFHYCSVGYLLAFFLGVLSVTLYYEINNKYLKYILPIICIVISLSMYQAYLSLIVTTFMIYQIHLLLHKKIDYKQSGIYLLLLLLSVMIYFICMKLSLLVFHIDMASYSNANGIGISTLLHFPQKFVDSYQLFYEMYFTNRLMKNTFLGNHVLHGVLIIFFIITLIVNVIQSKISTKDKIVTIVLTLLIPVFLNSIIFVISDTKLQLLMSASYLVFFIFMISFSYEKHLKVLFYIVLLLLLRNYLIQDQTTYITLENTFKKYDTVLSSAISNHINDLDKEFIVIGDSKNNDSSITNRNYGYISDEGLFWDEYNLRKLGFVRFCKQIYGIDVKFGDEDTYNYYVNNPTSEVIQEDGNVMIVNFSQVS